MTRGKSDDQPTGQKSKSKKNKEVESDNEDDKYKNNYDATVLNNQGDDDDLLLDVDIDGDAEWDDADGDADADGDDGDADADVDDAEGVGNIEDAVVDNNEDDDCAYNSTKKSGGIKKVSANIDRDDDDDDDNDIDLNGNDNAVNPDLYTKPEDRKSPPILTQFERVRLIGDRTAQLAQGAKPMIDGVNGMDPRVVSQLELESKMIPIKICRPMPNGKKEVWGLKELRLKKKYIVYGFTGGTVDTEMVNQIDNEYKKGGSIVGYSQLAAKYNSNKK